MEPQTKVTQDDVDSFLKSCEVQYHVFWDKELVVSYKCPNGFTISGRAALLGEAVARREVEETVWLLLGYQLQQKLFDEGLLE